MANDDDFSEVQKAVISGRVSTVVPIEIARRHQNPIVREELLLRTDVNQEEGSVYWHDLHLLVLDLSWIRKIHWVKRLRLARNGFRVIPNEIGGYLKQVRDRSSHVKHVHVHHHVMMCCLQKFELLKHFNCKRARVQYVL